LGAPGCTASGGVEALCLISCNLGCTETGCAISDIYQNQQISLAFNQDVSPASVTPSSVSLRTASGEEPVGVLLTQNNLVTFVPEIRVKGGASFFGFTPQETYQLRLPGGANEINALRSVSGDPFAKTMTCNLRVTKGILDLDGQPPTSELRSPAALTNVAPNTSIVLEFSEIIDNTPFLGPAGTEPIDVLVGRTRVAAGGGIECNPLVAPVKLRGSWSVTNNVVLQMSTATFTPSQVIPNSVCVTINVTPGVVDLSGKPSPGESHTFITVVGNQPLVPVTEGFVDDLQFDREASAGNWVGGAAPGLVGWDGLHGPFDPQLGNPVSAGVFEVSTDNHVIPKSNLTLSGNDETINDGVFRFTSFVIPAGQTVRFVGSNPARIYVRGEARIEGTIEVNGESLAEPKGSNAIGQAGGKGGVSGGAAAAGGGGKGANKSNGSNLVAWDGQDGQPVQVPPSHAYAGAAVDTGGKGSQHFPLQNTTAGCTPATCVQPGLRGFFSIQISAGGGGGGYDGAGGAGSVIQNPNEFGINQPQFQGPDGPGGGAFQFLPFPAGGDVMDHFLVGGSGGGGGGSHPYNSPSIPPTSATWRSGGGGGSGGGAVGLRVGGGMLIGGSGGIVATGGSTQASASNGFAVPGGGGSGGSVVIQCSEVPLQSGLIDVSGGTGGTVLGGFIAMQSTGGDGAPGYFRIEAPEDPPTAESQAALWAGNTNPPPALRNLAKLTERDATTGVQSLYFETNQIFPPEYVRYEISATVNGVAVRYSDDPNVGSLASSSEPIEFLIQGASTGITGQIDPTTATPWRHYVGNQYAPVGESLADDGGTGFRWLLLFHQSDNVVIHSVTVYLRV